MVWSEHIPTTAGISSRSYRLPMHINRREYYYFAILVFLAGFAGSAVLTYRSGQKLYAWKDALLRVTAPGEHDLSLAEPGRYTVFYEYEGVLDGQAYSTG